MARSKYYGYTMYGCPGFQRWSLAELPLSVVSVFNLTNNPVVVPAGDNIPIHGTVINQVGASLQNNSVWIPAGFYKIGWSSNVTTEAAAQVIISLNGTGGPLSTTNENTSAVGLTITMGRETFITVGPAGTTLTLTNQGTTEITVGPDLQLSITRIL